jgi:hypothetical protein
MEFGAGNNHTAGYISRSSAIAQLRVWNTRCDLMHFGATQRLISERPIA